LSGVDIPSVIPKQLWRKKSKEKTLQNQPVSQWIAAVILESEAHTWANDHSGKIINNLISGKKEYGSGKLG
jgi:hypothetical protein